MKYLGMVFLAVALLVGGVWTYLGNDILEQRSAATAESTEAANVNLKVRSEAPAELEVDVEAAPALTTEAAQPGPQEAELTNREKIAELQRQIDDEQLIERANANDLSESEADRLEELMSAREALILVELEKELADVEANIRSAD